MKEKIKKILMVLWFVGMTFGVLYSQDGVRVPLNRFFETGKFKLSETSTTDTIAYNPMMVLIGDTCLLLVSPDKNINRTSWSEAIDTSSFRWRFTSPTGKPVFMWANATGSRYGLDSNGKFTTPSDFWIGGDGVTVSQKGMVIGYNSSGTQGAYINSTADNFLRIRNAGVSQDATVQMGKLITSNVTAPATAGSTGTQGEVRFASDGYIYICTATNTWVRAQGSTW